MMGKKIRDLEYRRQELQERSAVERRQMVAHFEPWVKPLSWADKGIDTFNFLRGNPVLWSTAFAALAHYKPKLASKVLAVGWGVMKLLKGAKNII